MESALADRNARTGGAYPVDRSVEAGRMRDGPLTGHLDVAALQVAAQVRGGIGHGNPVRFEQFEVGQGSASG